MFTQPLNSSRIWHKVIFKRSLTGLNSEYSFSYTSCLAKAEEPSLPYYLPIAGGRIIRFIPFPKVLVLLLYSYNHDQLYKHICMRNHINTQYRRATQFLEKYTSHFIERVVCERELETEQNCNILTSTLLAITTFLSRPPGLLNRGPGGPLCWLLAFSTASCHQRVWSPN